MNSSSSSSDQERQQQLTDALAQILGMHPAGLEPSQLVDMLAAEHNICVCADDIEPLLNREPFVRVSESHERLRFAHCASYPYYYNNLAAIVAGRPIIDPYADLRITEKDAMCALNLYSQKTSQRNDAIRITTSDAAPFSCMIGFRVDGESFERTVRVQGFRDKASAREAAASRALNVIDAVRMTRHSWARMHSSHNDMFDAFSAWYKEYTTMRGERFPPLLIDVVPMKTACLHAIVQYEILTLTADGNDATHERYNANGWSHIKEKALNEAMSCAFMHVSGCSRYNVEHVPKATNHSFGSSTLTLGNEPSVATSSSSDSSELRPRCSLAQPSYAEVLGDMCRALEWKFNVKYKVCSAGEIRTPGGVVRGSSVVAQLHRNSGTVLYNSPTISLDECSVHEAQNRAARFVLEWIATVVELSKK